MTSSRSYLLRAIYDWLNDNQLTPYLLVDAEYENVVVPTEYIQDGKIILNVSYSAIELLDIQLDCVTFSARFSGKPMEIYVPMQAALALYAMENFPDEPEEEEPQQQAEDKPALTPVSNNTSNEEKTSVKKKTDRPSFLKVIK